MFGKKVLVKFPPVSIARDMLSPRRRCSPRSTQPARRGQRPELPRLLGAPAADRGAVPEAGLAGCFVLLAWLLFA